MKKILSRIFRVLVLAGMARVADASEFIPLGDFIEGSFASGARAISADGSTVVGGGNRYGAADTFSDAFRWNEQSGLTALETLPKPVSRTSDARGVSGNGSIIVGHLNYDSGPVNIEAFRWTAADGVVGMGHLPGGTTKRSNALDVSTNGEVVVGWSTSQSGPQAIVWRQSTGMVGIGDFPDGEYSSSASAVSADGDVVVGAGTTATGIQAFRWTSISGMTSLGNLQFDISDGAVDVSNDGTTIVGWSRGRTSFTAQAFRWNESIGMQALGDLPGGDFNSQALCVSADGALVLGFGHRSTGYKAFVWDALHGMRDLQEVLSLEYGLGAQLSNWSLTGAMDISDDGLSIVGYGSSPSGSTEAWLVRLDHSLSVPEPAGLTTLLGTLFLRRLRFR